MVTQPIACAFWTKFAAAPPAFFASAEGKRLTARAVEMVRQREGNEEAAALQNLITVAECSAVVFGV